MILKATKMGDCLYCVTQHEVVSGRMGITPEKQRDIVGVEYQTSEHFTDAEGPSPGRVAIATTRAEEQSPDQEASSE